MALSLHAPWGGTYVNDYVPKGGYRLHSIRIPLGIREWEGILDYDLATFRASDNVDSLAKIEKPMTFAFSQDRKETARKRVTLE